MNENTKKIIHWSFWIICVITLIWNVLGAINFLVQLNPDTHTAYRETERLIIVGRPLWATLGFALAVFGGTIGCALLLFKKAISYYVFIASFVGVLITMLHALTTGIEFKFAEVFGIILFPILVGGFLIWYAKFCERSGWIV
ncbi:MAG: hypothetical protein H6696_12560 [Deferribacteres bacterium]|nr:hypothetical protein [candidate division KSB1 bacterium]MCB9502759.1 hypothetical protein [Deferribacteres bacterium]